MFQHIFFQHDYGEYDGAVIGHEIIENRSKSVVSKLIGQYQKGVVDLGHNE